MTNSAKESDGFDKYEESFDIFDSFLEFVFSVE